MDTKKNPRPAATGAGVESGNPANPNPTPKLRPTSKKLRVLKALAAGGKYHRFQAEHALNDHCLHSTVAEIQGRYGIEVAREFVKVPGYMGEPTRVCSYWLDDRNRAKARKLLQVMGVRSGPYRREAMDDCLREKWSRRDGEAEAR
ncbi:hypothetical protein ECTPHS_09458 [Ectothiorhodospira sp. PHS-1]|uniref:hypothetical protein n=1 Tax=Ectothiorhodospira sp. PHS-1 TaxID=519989 RepID=UPI00024A8707|nr:hypothetical protein [Ectothiorhodospira sp. PHS-1]EHQ52908.1 hypothetical protein ECTPHS_09458 [Ectothiorhodospira sp. PHS-1]